MTLDDLDTWRKRIPVVLFTLCALPYLVLKMTGEQFKLYHDTLVPALAICLGFFYVGLRVRDLLWEEEMDTYVRAQIRKAIVDMVPADLNITDPEKQRLLDGQVYRKLSGVFWQTVGESPELTAQKNHFYSNGIIYSTSFDVFIICGLSAIFFYTNAALATGLVQFVYVGFFLYAIALLSRALITPRCREQHLALSQEQLETIRTKHRTSVEDKFRRIILEWRSNPALDH